MNMELENPAVEIGEISALLAANGVVLDGVDFTLTNPNTAWLLTQKKWGQFSETNTMFHPITGN